MASSRNAAAEEATFGGLYRDTLLAERRQAVLDVLLRGCEQVAMSTGERHDRVLALLNRGCCDR